MYVAWGKPFYLLVRLRERLQVDGTCNLMLCVCFNIRLSWSKDVTDRASTFQNCRARPWLTLSNIKFY